MLQPSTSTYIIFAETVVHHSRLISCPLFRTAHVRATLLPDIMVGVGLIGMRKPWAFSLSACVKPATLRPAHIMRLVYCFRDLFQL